MRVGVRLTVWKRDKSTGDDDGRRNEARGGLMSPKIRSSGRRYDIMYIINYNVIYQLVRMAQVCQCAGGTMDEK